MIITTRLVIFISKPQLNVQSTAAKLKKETSWFNQLFNQLLFFDLNCHLFDRKTMVCPVKYVGLRNLIGHL